MFHHWVQKGVRFVSWEAASPTLGHVERTHTLSALTGAVGSKQYACYRYKNMKNTTTARPAPKPTPAPAPAVPATAVKPPPTTTPATPPPSTTERVVVTADTTDSGGVDPDEDQPWPTDVPFNPNIRHASPRW